MSKILAEGSATQEVTLLTIADEDSTKRNWGVLLPGIIGGTLVALYSVAIPFIAPALRKHCLPFVPATSKQIENVLITLKGRKGMLVDIGSGDGRIVSFSQYTNIVIFGVPQMMLQLEKKLGDELLEDARVIACRFPFPHWRPNHSFGEGIDTVWAYDSKSFRMEKEDDTTLVKGIPPT
ncbi:ATP synthase subunit C lysine N-methyltransferase isoform X2 [Thamnophis elegans]|uniref:ATP synthase subunit C lysine N-methyltransferase isoform X2 n=1 Tax=Thamnophis elegans TaxID=35005 RepID=UPI0013785E94|nr:ATP synthase subunit C lysine N-methyltransferase isoform X2 [Thamnophis elegans]